MSHLRVQKNRIDPTSIGCVLVRDRLPVIRVEAYSTVMSNWLSKTVQ